MRRRVRGLNQNKAVKAGVLALDVLLLSLVELQVSVNALP